jgi:mannosyltransferase OCH1-like enzyme
MPIPKCLHQIWFQGASKIPAKYKPAIQLWKQFHPDYTYYLWSEKSLKELIWRNFAWMYDAWCKLPHMIQKIDLAKLCILYKYGGVYCDMDMTPLRSITPKLEGWDMVLSQCDMDVFREWVSQFLGIPYFSQHHINNAFIGVIPRHAGIGEALYLAVHNGLLVDKEDDMMLHEIYTTLTCGPEILNQAYSQLKDKSLVKVYPPDIFEPKLDETTNEPMATPETVVVHNSERTWVKQVKRWGAEDIAKWAYWLLVLILVIAIIVVLIWGLRRMRAARA